MSYVSMYLTFKVEVIAKVKELLDQKGYNREVEWENNPEEVIRFDYVESNGEKESLALIEWDVEDQHFIVISNYTNQKGIVYLSDLYTLTICKIIDYLNDNTTENSGV